MTNPYLTLEGVSWVLPDGRTLFSDLHEIFDLRHTGLVGRNGVGKTVLARILSGDAQPSTGRCSRIGTVHYLPQHVARSDPAPLSRLAGVQGALDALQRIEAGSMAAADFDALAERWDLRQRLRAELERNGLAHLGPDTCVSTLSGGEAMRVALIGAMLSDADFLILDEPSNHLDRPSRQTLIEYLRRWPRGLLVISHDRALLDAMERTVELSSLGLRSYGGGYAFYAQCKAQEQEHALHELEQRKHERRREEKALREQRERLARRQARGHRQGQQANQAKILLDRQQQRSESSAGKLLRQHASARERLDRRVREAAQQVPDEAGIALHAVPLAQAAQRRVVELQAVELPFVPPATRAVDLILTGQQRIGIVGPNGCGKSTLLKLLAGQLKPRAGRCLVHTATAYLDQHLADLDPSQSVLDQVCRANPTADVHELRMKLAQLGLDAGRITVASGELSGGERLKAALARAVYAEPPAGLLLLDEPGNHLDLPSLQALETLLRDYRGALAVVSHDDAFLAAIEVTDRLVATPRGWLHEPCGTARVQ